MAPMGGHWLTGCRKILFRLKPVLRPKGQKGFVLLARGGVVERTFAWPGFHAFVQNYERYLKAVRLSFTLL